VQIQRALDGQRMRFFALGRHVVDVAVGVR
jgi:hypothetical protein